MFKRVGTDRHFRELLHMRYSGLDNALVAVVRIESGFHGYGFHRFCHFRLVLVENSLQHLCAYERKLLVAVGIDDFVAVVIGIEGEYAVTTLCCFLDASFCFLIIGFEYLLQHYCGDEFEFDGLRIRLLNYLDRMFELFGHGDSTWLTMVGRL